MGDAVVTLQPWLCPQTVIKDVVMREAWEIVGAQERGLTQPRKDFLEER